MPRFISILLLLATCALCFLAGYKLGTKSQPLEPVPAVTEAIIINDAPIEPLTDTGEQPQVTVEPTKDEPALDPFALRAQKTVQTFFDKDERPLVAEILEVRADSLKVRRQSDGYKLELPVAMLSTEDQAFAAYLWEQQPNEVAQPVKLSERSQEDIFWDALFE